MFQAFNKVLQEIRSLNRKRICLRRARKLAQVESVPLKVAPEYTPYLSNVKSTLLICRHTGWGDTLFLNGLIQTLLDEGIKVDIAVKSCSLNRYGAISLIGAVYDIDTALHKDICNKEYDCIVDLDYIARPHCNTKFIHSCSCLKITCSNVYRYLSTFDYYFDFSKFPHISDRYSYVASSLAGKKLQIKPKVTLSSSHLEQAQNFLSKIEYLNKPFVYINTVGRDADRCFSRNQIIAILETVLAKTDWGVIIYCPNMKLDELFQNTSQTQGRLFHAPNTDFFSIAAIVKQSRAIISPDTSIVHLASSFGIPVMAVFCQDDIDYFKKYFVSEVWAPLSKGSLIVDFSRKNLLFPKTIAISHLRSNLSSETTQFLNSLVIQDLDS